MFFPKEGETRKATLTTIQHLNEKEKSIQIGDLKIKLFLYRGDMIVYVENPPNLKASTIELNKIVRLKVNM